jgi:hypothetical protein
MILPEDIAAIARSEFCSSYHLFNAVIIVLIQSKRKIIVLFMPTLNFIALEINVE